MKKAITLVEVLVSAIILASVLSGIVATFVSVRRSVGKGGERVTASNLARGRLDSLFAEVRADHLDPNSNSTYLAGNALAAGSSTTQTMDNVEYTVGYEVETPSTTDDYLNVTATVNFTVKGD